MEHANCRSRLLLLNKHLTNNVHMFTCSNNTKYSVYLYRCTKIYFPCLSFMILKLTLENVLHYFSWLYSLWKKNPENRPQWFVYLHKIINVTKKMFFLNGQMLWKVSWSNKPVLCNLNIFKLCSLFFMTVQLKISDNR